MQAQAVVGPEGMARAPIAAGPPLRAAAQPGAAPATGGASSIEQLVAAQTLLLSRLAGPDPASGVRDIGR
eukprot:920125-Alexandrium_andersonii.AAC.1